VKDSLLERFLRYVKIDTQSDPFSDSAPTTAKQLDLLRLLVQELHELGVENVRMSEQGSVYARLESNLPEGDPHHGSVPTIGFIAHVDTSPDASGTGVKPLVHRNYQGGDVVLDEDAGIVIRAEENPHLASWVGCDIITSDGSTLLGADDKAGVAAIMDLVDRLVHSPDIHHGPLAIGFTTDEEVGKGVDHFDVETFGARYAYTVDGGPLGHIDTETFNAHMAVFEIQGVGIHPGRAYGKLVNASLVASAIAERLPRDIRPETTRDRQGYILLHYMKGKIESASLRVLIRDFEEEGSREKIELLHGIAQEVEGLFPGANVKLEVTESYRNMGPVLAREPKVVDLAMEAARRADIEPRKTLVRGGTDGARLSYMGLPTPNLFTTGENYHSPLEWIPLQGLEKTVETLVHLVRLWAERGAE
jgi:tripeptide aminopeptidase